MEHRLQLVIGIPPLKNAYTAQFLFTRANVYDGGAPYAYDTVDRQTSGKKRYDSCQDRAMIAYEPKQSVH
jgi:hypothetical protein